MSVEQPQAWISRTVVPGAEQGPLAGLTFAIKDNIDLAGVPTTAGDPRRCAPAHESAPVVARLLAAGATALGKTNMDQYATGLVGTRSPFGACHSVASTAHVSGGSSSGSAVVVARGEVDFALATDTAGSGRVPAAFNGLVGIKPSKGQVSTRGVVPACRSLDCVTVLARDLETARRAYEVMTEYDDADPYARQITQREVPERRPILGVPDVDLDLSASYEAPWREAVARVSAVADIVPVPVEVLLGTAELLYGGPWLAERWHAFGAALNDDMGVDPAVRSIVSVGASVNGPEVFAGYERLAELARRSSAVWKQIDALLLPVAREHPTLAEVAADPIGVNTRLGRFTNMTNLLDLCAIAFPGPVGADGLPFGVQLLAPAGCDDVIHAVAADVLAVARPSTAPACRRVNVAVAGAHLDGQPLNADLRARGGRFEALTRTAPDYRMFVVDGPLPRPGVTRVIDGPSHDGLEVEVWSLPETALAGFAATIAPPLGLGSVDLIDGQRVLGFICSADGARPERDITMYGGWRAYLASR